MAEIMTSPSNTVTVTISGPVGSGKSAIAGEIEVALRFLGVPVTWANPAAALSEANLTHSDWAAALAMYRPSVVLVEANIPTPKQRRQADVSTVYSEDAWREDEGPVLWHHIGEYGDLCEAPIVADGFELDDKQPWPGYYSHWSRLPYLPQFPIRALKIAPPESLICDWETP